jgi:hypothetical protein
MKYPVTKETWQTPQHYPKIGYIAHMCDDARAEAKRYKAALEEIRKMIAGRAKTNTMGGQVIIDGMLFELILDEIAGVADGKSDDNL